MHPDPSRMPVAYTQTSRGVQSQPRELRGNRKMPGKVIGVAAQPVTATPHPINVDSLKCTTLQLTHTRALKELDDADLVGHVKSVIICSQAHVRLFQPVGPDQRVDLGGLDLIHAAHSLSDLLLVGTSINNEDESVVVLDLLHSRFGGKGVLKNLVLIELVDARNRPARVLRLPEQTERLRAVECGTLADLASTLAVGAGGERLGSLLSLLCRRHCDRVDSRSDACREG
mmetsp:Transcript_8131/g.24430  ORF Transcript_8131/g.24430 Transcript_8131/m.24430 type:complete len:229 (+) Transcript_8131:349-1035(+)